MEQVVVVVIVSGSLYSNRILGILNCQMTFTFPCIGRASSFMFPHGMFLAMNDKDVLKSDFIIKQLYGLNYSIT